jgi:nitrile hydratase
MAALPWKAACLAAAGRFFYPRITRCHPRAVLAEFGTQLSDGVTVRVHDSTADIRYVVLPTQPKGSEGRDEARLAALVTRDPMIGVTTL